MMKILMVASESMPYTKESPLSELTHALSAGMKKMNHDVRIVMPKYRNIDFGRTRPLKVLDKYPVNLGNTTEYCSIYEGKRDDGVICYWIENNRFFGREGMYGEKQGAYQDNHLRFALFSLGALGVVQRKLFTPQIMHVYDWQASLIPIYLKNNLVDEHITSIPVILSIQNLAQQGIIEKRLAGSINIDTLLLTVDMLEVDGKCNILKGGIIFADHITTVSPSYAAEIMTPDSGLKLDAALKRAKGKVTGILNGIDYDQWDPEHDSHIPYSYTREVMSGKLLNKSNFIKKQGFEVDINLPLIGVVSEFADEKGTDILAQVIPDLVEENILLTIHGEGDKIYEELIKDLARRHPESIHSTIGKDNELIHQIYAASDIILIPFRSEPCGTNQIIAFKYGAVPVVRATGGLKDAVQEFSPKTGEGNGFVFQKFTTLAFFRAIRRALDTYKTGRIWKELVKTCMSYDFSWNVTTQKYLALYDQLLGQQ
jgi:starch synthase